MRAITSSGARCQRPAAKKGLPFLRAKPKQPHSSTPRADWPRIMALIASLRQSHVLAAAMMLAYATAIEASGATLREKAKNVHHVLPRDRGENALPPRGRAPDALAP